MSKQQWFSKNYQTPMANNKIQLQKRPAEK